METVQPQPMQTDDDEEELRAAIALSMQPAAVVLGGAPAATPAEPAAPPADLQLLPPMRRARAVGRGARRWPRAAPDAVLRQGAQGVCGGAAGGGGGRELHGGAGESRRLCAVLAAAQAFLVRRLLFDLSPAAPRAAAETAWLDAAPGAGLAAVDALRAPPRRCGRRCSPASPTCCGRRRTPCPSRPKRRRKVALPPDDALPFVGRPPRCPRCSSTASAARRGAAQRLARGLAALGSEVGALALLCSALLTRGLCRVAERDDTGIPLVDPIHGHCSQ